MRNATRLVLATLLLAGSAAASAQTADEIIEKHIAAVGGREALGKLRSRTMTGTIALTSPQGELAGSIVLTEQVPNKERTLITLDLSALGAGQMTFDQRFDGQAGYVLDSLQGNREITGSQLENMKNGAFPNDLLDYRARGIKVTLAGREKVGDRDAYVLLLTPPAGSAARMYVDAASYIVIRAVTTVEAPGVGTLEQTTDLLDYRSVDGVMVPFQVKTSSSVQAISVTVTKVEHNGPVDETLFSKPAN